MTQGADTIQEAHTLEPEELDYYEHTTRRCTYI